MEEEVAVMLAKVLAAARVSWLDEDDAEEEYRLALAPVAGTEDLEAVAAVAAAAVAPPPLFAPFLRPRGLESV